MNGRLWIVIALAVATAAISSAEDPPAAPVPSTAGTQPASTSRPAGRIVKFPSIRADLDARQVVLDAAVRRREGYLEMLVCRLRGKEHETILATEARPSHLHAALLALGLTQGIPAEWSHPGEDAKFLPPRGPELKIALRWKDKDGKPRQADAAEWLKRRESKTGALPAGWVFVGGQISPSGAYVADLPEHDHIIAVSNFSDSVVEVPVQSTEAEEQWEFEANTVAIPPVGTNVEVVLTPVPDAEKSPYARALVEIDAQGRVTVDGNRLPPDGLEEWAAAFAKRFPKGQVVLRADGRALVHDVAVARQQLRLGWIRDVRDEFLGAAGAVLPRTQEQLREAMAEWAKRFADPSYYIVDPGEQARAELEEIDLQLRQSDGRRELWREYARRLRAEADKYRATTQPGKTPGGTEAPAPSPSAGD